MHGHMDVKYSGTVGTFFKRDKLKISENNAYEQSSRDSSVTIVTRLLAGRSAVRFVAGDTIFSCPLKRAERSWGATSFSFTGKRVSFSWG